MISKEAKTAKEKLFQNKNLEEILSTPIEIQREEWEESVKNIKLPSNRGNYSKEYKSGLDNTRIYYIRSGYFLFSRRWSESGVKINT